jgi:hypothetical protein
MNEFYCCYECAVEHWLGLLFTVCIQLKAVASAKFGCCGGVTMTSIPKKRKVMTKTMDQLQSMVHSKVHRSYKVQSMHAQN